MRYLPVVLLCRRGAILPRAPDTPQIGAIPPRSEGRFAIVTDVECGMRWTWIAPLTNGANADGEVVWS